MRIICIMHENGDERYDEECIFPYLLEAMPYIFNTHQQKEDWDERQGQVLDL